MLSALGASHLILKYLPKHLNAFPVTSVKWICSFLCLALSLSLQAAIPCEELSGRVLCVLLFLLGSAPPSAPHTVLSSMFERSLEGGKWIQASSLLLYGFWVLIREQAHARTPPLKTLAVSPASCHCASALQTVPVLRLLKFALYCLMSVFFLNIIIEHFPCVVNVI